MEQAANQGDRLFKLGNPNQVKFRDTLLAIDDRFAFRSYDQILSDVADYCDKPTTDLVMCYLLGQAIVDIADTFRTDETTVIRAIVSAASDVGRGVYGVAFEPSLRADVVN